MQIGLYQGPHITVVDRRYELAALSAAAKLVGTYDGQLTSDIARKIYEDDLKTISSGALYNREQLHLLRPNGPVMVDAKYLVSILGGVYGRVHPEQALRVMKRELETLDFARERVSV